MVIYVGRSGGCVIASRETIEVAMRLEADLESTKENKGVTSEREIAPCITGNCSFE